MGKRIKLKDVEYVKLWPAEFLIEFQDNPRWSIAEFGVYVMLNFLLYKKGGKMDFNEQDLAAICRMPVDEFAKTWKKVESKFQKRAHQITHKKIVTELRRARKTLQDAVNAGVIGAEKRWRPHSDPNRGAVAINETKPKQNNIYNTNTKKSSDCVTSSLRLRQAIEILPRMKALNQSDRTAYNNLVRWLDAQVLENRFNGEIYKRVLDMAVESSKHKSANNPKAVFFAALKRELGYKKS